MKLATLFAVRERDTEDSPEAAPEPVTPSSALEEKRAALAARVEAIGDEEAALRESVATAQEARDAAIRSGEDDEPHHASIEAARGRLALLARRREVLEPELAAAQSAALAATRAERAAVIRPVVERRAETLALARSAVHTKARELRDAIVKVRRAAYEARRAATALEEVTGQPHPTAPALFQGDIEDTWRTAAELEQRDATGTYRGLEAFPMSTKIMLLHPAQSPRIDPVILKEEGGSL